MRGGYDILLECYWYGDWSVLLYRADRRLQLLPRAPQCNCNMTSAINYCLV